jgi:PAS domain-containing protein
MFNFLKNIFSQERLNKKADKAVDDLISITTNGFDTKKAHLTREKLNSLSALSLELSEAANAMREVSGDLIDKLNSRVEGLTTEIHAISESATDGIMTLDYRGNIINLNHAVEQIFEYEFEELTGKDISKILPISIPGYDENVHSFCDIMQYVSQNIYNNLKYNGGSLNINNYFSLSKTNRTLVGKTKNGRNIFLEMNVNVINPGVLSFEKLQYICVMKDITELTRTKQEINKLVNFQLSLVEAIPNAVFWKDKDYRYLGCNSEFERMTGFKRDEILGKTLAELCDELEKTLQKGEIVTLLEEKMRLIQGEESLKTLIDDAIKHGKSIADIKRTPVKNILFNKITQKMKDIVIYRTIVVDEDGNFNGLVCSIMDVSKLVELKEHPPGPIS